ncbi:MAG TPA: trehalose-phosphatase, partial [Candidatus Dormibacteraeota bacterium]|nr:trehalose-phosphatase [Candidatus Dormibacteraeota bacterium]
EPKGSAVAFHYRSAQDRVDARRRLDAALDTARRLGLLDPFRIMEGRLLLDVQPAEAGAKGEATDRLIEEVTAASALVIGDDRADAEAFEALAGARSAGRLEGSLAVGVRHPHPLPPEVEAAADLVVDGVPEAIALLSALAARLEGEGPPGRAEERADPAAGPAT